MVVQQLYLMHGAFRYTCTFILILFQFCDLTKVLVPLLFASQVECSLIAMPECLVEAEADAGVHGCEDPMYGLCPVADIW